MRSIVVVPDQRVEETVLCSIERELRSQLAVVVTRQDVFPDTAATLQAGRSQYDSACILQALSARCGREEWMLGVTNKDLCLPMLSFVFGHAQLRGRVGVVSLARLRQEFYTLPADSPLLEVRAAKEGLHEVGHALGLVHCVERSCVMSLATDVGQVDEKQTAYCRTCRALLRELRMEGASDEAGDASRRVQR